MCKCRQSMRSKWERLCVRSPSIWHTISPSLNPAGTTNSSSMGFLHKKQAHVGGAKVVPERGCEDADAEQDLVEPGSRKLESGSAIAVVDHGDIDGGDGDLIIKMLTTTATTTATATTSCCCCCCCCCCCFFSTSSCPSPSSCTSSLSLYLFSCYCSSLQASWLPGV